VLDRLRRPWPDHRAELLLGAVACLLAVAIVAMIVFVARGAWPTFAHDGFSLFGSHGNVDSQLGAMENTSRHPPASAYTVHAWPLIYGTLLSAGLALIVALAVSLASAIFIVDFAPAPVRRIMGPVIRLLASVPSVLYGLVGILVLVPFTANHLVSNSEKRSVEYVVQLTGGGLAVAVVLLALMITPIMTALITDALESVPRPWREGAIALGLNPLRATIAVSLRAIRPAIVAAAGLAAARALGEAIVISMVSGGVSFAPNPADGTIFWFEPFESLASTIIRDAESLNAPALHATLYAFAALLLFSSLVLSLAAYLVRLPLRRYQLSA
jgi:ABC-type phosphate transport system permease subunit